MKKLTAVHSIISIVIVMISVVLALLPMEKSVHLFWLIMVSEGTFLVLTANMASYLTSCFYLRKQMDVKGHNRVAFYIWSNGIVMFWYLLFLLVNQGR